MDQEGKRYYRANSLIDVRNIPEGTFDGNRVPFFRDMWGEETQFIDDATDQSIKIKGFDLDFDPLTWKILGAWASEMKAEKVGERYE